MRKLRKSMIILFCGGVFLCGLGAGVAFGEYSGFQYGGEVMLDAERMETEQLKVQLLGKTEEVNDVYLPWQMRSLSDVTYSAAVPEDEVWFDVTYNAAVYKPYTVIRQEPTEEYLESYRAGAAEDTGAPEDAPEDPAPVIRKNDQYVTIGLDSQNEVEVFVRVKDAVLEDLKNHRIGSYDVKGVEKVTATVNPAMKGRLYLR